MANTPVYVDLASSGLTGHVLYVYGLAGDDTNNPNDDGFDNISGPDALTELTNIQGLYRTYIDEALDGWHLTIVRASVGGAIVATGWVFLTDTINAHYVTFDVPEEVQPSGALTTGSTAGTDAYYNVVIRGDEDSEPIYFWWPTDETLTATRAINGAATYTATGGSVSQIREEADGFLYQLSYDANDRPEEGTVVYAITDGSDTRFLPLSIDTGSGGGGGEGDGSVEKTITITSAGNPVDGAGGGPGDDNM